MCVFSSDCVESYTARRRRGRFWVHRDNHHEHPTGTGVAGVYRMQWVDACLFQILTRVVDYTSDLLYCATDRSFGGTIKLCKAADHGEMKVEDRNSEVDDQGVLYNENIVAPAISCIIV